MYEYQLPVSYTIVPAVALKTTSVSVPPLMNESATKEGCLTNAQLQERLFKACQPIFGE